tara:strand:- start:6424 stop:6831 length:408 start_codon:yes stop_codon:yes gene_type:complete
MVYTDHWRIVATFKRLKGLGLFMLKANELKLMNGNSMSDVELIPTDDGYVIIDGEEVIHIMHHAVLSIKYTDPGSAHFAKGRALAMYYDDAEKVREILEDFDYELEELSSFISESLEPSAESNSDSAPKGDNPYE